MPDIFKDKYFLITIGLVILVVALFFISADAPPIIPPPETQAQGTGCPNSSGLDKYGNPCPVVGLDCPSSTGLDRFGNPCPVVPPPPPCNTVCDPNKKGYDMCGNFRVFCAGTGQ